MTKVKNDISIESVRKQIISILTDAHIPHPGLECDLVIAHVIRKSRVFLYSHPEILISIGNIKKILTLIKKRSKNIPLAYLISKKNFFNLSFYICPGVLIPRPETELLIERTLHYLQSRRSKKTISMLDIGTGSGCIGLTIAHTWNTFPLSLTAIDISQTALTCARKNYRMLKKKYYPLHTIHFKKISLTNHRVKKYDIITANLPYLSAREYTTACKHYPEISKEPKSALISSLDGCAHIFNTLQRLPEILNRDGCAFFECSSRQEKKISAYIKDHLPHWKWSFVRDYSNKTSIMKLARVSLF